MDKDPFIEDLQKAKAKLVWLVNRLGPEAEEHQDCVNHIAKLDSAMELHRATTEKNAVASSPPAKTEEHIQVQEKTCSQSVDKSDPLDDEWVELDADDEGYVVI